MPNIKEPGSPQGCPVLFYMDMKKLIKFTESAGDLISPDRGGIPRQ